MKKSLSLKIISLFLASFVLAVINLPADQQKRIILNPPTWLSGLKIHLGLDLQGGTQLDYKIDLRKVPADRQKEIIDGVVSTINRRVNGLGVSEPNIYTSQVADEHHVVVELAGIKDIEEAKATVGKTIQLEFKEKKSALETNEKDTILAETKTIFDKIKSGGDFATIAKEESQSAPDKITFNEAKDYYFADQLPASAKDKLMAATPGELISEIIELTEQDGELTIDADGQLTTITGYAIYKLQDKKPTERKIDQPKEVAASHILVNYKGASGQGNESNTRTEAEAKTRAEEALAKLKAGGDFIALAKEYSDDPGSKANGGKLPDAVKDGGIYDPDFTAATLRLAKVEDISEIIKTQFGFHIIKADNLTPASTTYKVEPQIKYDRLLLSTVPDEWKETALTGKNFKLANVEFNQAYQPYVSIQFDEEGAKLFEEITGRNVGKQVAIFVGGTMISAPNVNEKISGGNAQISGSFTVEEATTLARDLNTGAIPAPIILSGQHTIGASLGQEALQKSLKAGLIGFGVVVLFMILNYGLAGVLAAFALIIYTLLLLFVIKGPLPFPAALTVSIIIFTLITGKILKSEDSGLEKLVSFLIGCFVLFFLSFVLSNPVVLTLAGIAGIVLSIGMAVDANILIFERIKEELSDGQPLHMAIERGFNRAWPSIRDSNFSTLITCAILMYFGTSIIKGFAFNLSVGVLISMFTAITVTRTFLQFIADKKIAQSGHFFSLLKGQKRVTSFHIIKNTKKWLSFSALLIIIPIIALISFEVKLGLDFTGGSLLEIKFQNEIKNEQIVTGINEIKAQIDKNNQATPDSALTPDNPEGLTADLGNPIVVSSGDKTYNIRIKSINNATHNYLIAELKTKLGELEETRYNIIGPTVGQTLRNNSLKALAIALIMIVLYIAFAFREIPKRINPWRFGTTAILALVHDVFITFGIYVIISDFVPNVEIDTLLITALLTTLGFSVHDTIVVFDRIRENLKHQKRDESFEDVADKALNQTLKRSVNTSLTALLAIFALFLFGAEAIKYFVLTLIIGISIGTYSSIFVATPLLVAWWKKANK